MTLKKIINGLKDIRGLAQMEDVDDINELGAALMDIDEKAEEMINQAEREIKMTKLNRAWKNCLRMWKWIAEVYDGIICVDDLKKQWLKKHRFIKDIYNSCFFCKYTDNKNNDCKNCPAVLVDEDFNCCSKEYGYSDKPKAFYAEILRLNAIRIGE